MSDLMPKGWITVKVGDAVVSANGGVSVNSENRLKNINEFGILKTSSVFNGGFNPLEHKTILPHEVTRASVKPKKTILFLVA